MLTKAIAAVLSIMLIGGCAILPPLRIGFVTEQTGNNAALGIQGRNGALLAVEEINSTGGISGRKLELIVRDTLGDLTSVPRIDQELIDSGVLIFTGHMTSKEALAAIEVISNNNAILISPTASTPELSALQDSFYRLIPVTSVQAEVIADHILAVENHSSVGIVIDADNLPFTKPYMEAIKNSIGRQGGKVTRVISFLSSERPDLHQLLSPLVAENPDAVAVIASSYDTALVSQVLRLDGYANSIYASNWAYTPELIQLGGMAVEGLILSSHADVACDTDSYQSFLTNYVNTYGEEPTFSSILAFETIRHLADLLKRSGGDLSRIKAFLSVPTHIDGLCGEISLDAYGDANRPVYVIQVNSGRFTTLETFLPDSAWEE